MPFGLPRSMFSPHADTWLGRLLAPPHPDAFTAGRFERGRWRFRLSAVDPYQPDGVVTMRWGDDTLRLRVDSVRGPGPRPGHVLVTGLDEQTRQPIELSVPAGDVARFGLEP